MNALDDFLTGPQIEELPPVETHEGWDNPPVTEWPVQTPDEHLEGEYEDRHEEKV